MFPEKAFIKMKPFLETEMTRDTFLNYFNRDSYNIKQIERILVSNFTLNIKHKHHTKSLEHKK